MRYELHKKLLKLRNLYRLICTDDFQEAFAQCAEPEQAKVQALIDRVDQPGLERWLYQLRAERLENRTIRDLRRQAQALGVENYQCLPKASLLSAIHRRTNRENCQQQALV